MKREVIQWALRAESKSTAIKLALHPIHGEIVGARFMAALGIGTADVRLVQKSEAYKLGGKWICKFSTGDRVLAIRKVPGAIALGYLRQLHGIAAPEPEWRWQLSDGGEDALNMFHTAMAVWNATGNRLLSLLVPDQHPDVAVEFIREILVHGKSWQVPDAKQFFSDFQPANLETIKAAIQWNSEQMLKLHAGRLLLGCTLAHAGNVLVDGVGRLYSIDHEKIERSDGSDIEMLARHMKPGTRARRAVCDVANVLQPEAIWQLFDEVGLDWPLGSRSATIEYFENRVRKFQEHFQQ